MLIEVDLLDPPDGAYPFVEWDDLDEETRVALRPTRYLEAMPKEIAAYKAFNHHLGRHQEMRFAQPVKQWTCVRPDGHPVRGGEVVGGFTVTEPVRHVLSAGTMTTTFWTAEVWFKH